MLVSLLLTWFIQCVLLNGEVLSADPILTGLLPQWQVDLPVFVDGQPQVVHFEFEDPNMDEDAFFTLSSAFCKEYLKAPVYQCYEDIAAEMVVKSGNFSSLTTLPFTKAVALKLIQEGRADLVLPALEMHAFEATGDARYKEIIAAAYYQAGRLQQAKKLYRELVELDIGTEESKTVQMVNLGIVLINLGDLHSALEIMERAIKQGGAPNEDALFNRAKILAFLGDQKGALQAFSQLASINPKRGDTFREAGFMHLEMGLLEHAREELLTAVRLDGTDIGAWHRLQYLSLRKEQQEQAEAFGVVTFATDVKNCRLRRLAASCEYHNIPLQVLGAGLRRWEDGTWKIQLLLDYLRGASPKQLVCVVDVYDTVMAGSTAQAPTIYRFLDSGSFIGPAGDLLALVEEGIRQYGGPDKYYEQTIFMMMLLNQETEGAKELPRIEVDHFQDLFGNTRGREHNKDFDLQGGRVYNRRMDSFPVVLQSPGNQRVFEELALTGWDTPILACTE